MDRGAARSRKRAAHVERGVTSFRNPSWPKKEGRPPPSRTRPESLEDASPDNIAGPSKRSVISNPLASERQNDHTQLSTRREHFAKKRKHVEPQSRDPSLYVAKAVRTSSALIYASSPFPIPPPSLSGVTRLDLSGSTVEDVSWLEGSQVTWLNLTGCKVQDGWDAVGSLGGLTVLNVSDCGVTQLPKSLKALGKMKAFVGMNNPWKSLDEEVVAAWTELNSLIISHSPNLTSLPRYLNGLKGLSKLTFSHCPKLGTSGIPDLSSLPLLRDVKMNDLPFLNAIPSHMSAWGTGEMPAIEQHRDSSNHSKTSTTEVSRRGLGLQSLDIGRCAITYEMLSQAFGLDVSASGTSSRWLNLRSLTVLGNPLCSSHPEYSSSFLSADTLPKLQIVDNKRIKERHHKIQTLENGGASKTAKMTDRRSGSNRAKGEMREWGTATGNEPTGQAGNSSDPLVATEAHPEHIDESGLNVPTSTVQPSDRAGSKRKRHHTAKKATYDKQNDTSIAPPKSVVDEMLPAPRPKLSNVPGQTVKEPKQENRGDAPPPKKQKQLDSVSLRASTSKHLNTTEGKAPKKSETSVVQIIDVRKGVDAAHKVKASRKKAPKSGASVETPPAPAANRGGVDLKTVFGAKSGEEGTGLGLGGW